ncbi:MAG: L-lactate MFS transporter [Treponema sp.]
MEKKVNRWLILIAAIVVNLSLGAGYAWSVFQKALLAENAAQGWVVSQTSWAFSISFAMVPIAMILFGPIVDKNGPKKVVFLGGILFGLGMILTGFAKNIGMLYVTYGVILGFGIGTGYGTATAAAVKWFPDKKGLAGGLTAAGFGFGAIVLAPIATALIAKFGIYMTFKILGAILLLLIVASSAFMEKPPAPAASAAAANTSDKDFKQMLKEPNFWILWIVYIMSAVSGMMIIGHATGIAADYKIIAPTLGVIIVGFSNTFGRIFWGAVSDKIGRYNAIIGMFAMSIAGLLLLTYNQTLGTLLGLLGMMFIALAFGGFLGSFPGITAENWGVKNAGSNYGWMFTAYGVAAIVGPSLASSIKTAIGDYSFAFLASVGMSVVGILVALYYIKKSKKE